MKKHRWLRVRGMDIKQLFNIKHIPQGRCIITTMTEEKDDLKIKEYTIKPVNPQGRVLDRSLLLIRMNVHWTEPLPKKVKQLSPNIIQHATQRLEGDGYVYIGDDKYNRSIMVKVKDDGIKIDTIAVNSEGTLIHQYERTLL